MSRRFNLRSRFQTPGMFWAPTSPEIKFAGHLKADGKHIELTSSPTPGGMDILREILARRERARPEVLQGITKFGPCTLTRLTEMAGDPYLHTISGEGFRVRRYRASLCVIGLHLSSDEVPVITSGWSRYSGLEAYLPPGAFPSYEEGSIAVEYPMEPFSFVDLGSLKKRMRVALQQTWEFQEHGCPARHHARTEARLVIEPAQPQSLIRIFEELFQYENFFSLLLGTSSRLTTMCLTVANGDVGWVLGRGRRRFEKSDPQAWFPIDSDQLATALVNWIECDGLRPVEDLFFSVTDGMFIETEFLYLAQGIESFHRFTDCTKLIDRPTFKRIQKYLKTLILANSVDPLATRLIESMAHADEPAFRSRILALLGRVTEAHLRAIAGDPIVFAEMLKDTRNHFTHPGIKKKESVLTDIRELFLFNHKMRAVLRFLMLVNLGLSEDIVFPAVSYQARKWSMS